MSASQIKPDKSEQGGMESSKVLGRARRLKKLLESAGKKPEDSISRTAQTLLALGKEDILGKIEPFLAQEASHRIMEERLFPLPTEVPQSGVPVGVLENGTIYHYPEDDLPTGVLFLGAPKSGKTTAVCSLIESLHAQGHGFLIPDMRGDFQRLACSSDDVLYIPSEEDRINPLCPPPGVHQDIWIPVISARLTLDLGLQTAAQTYTTRNLFAHFDSMGEETPTLISFVDFLKGQKPKRMSSEEGYQERVVGRLEALILQIGRNVLDVQRGFPIIEEVEKGRIAILDMRKKDKLASDFLLAVRLYHLYFMRLVSEDPFGGPLTFIVLDEQRSFIRKQTHDYGIPDIELLFSRSRALNLAFLVLEQIPSAVSPAVLSASRLRIGFHSAPPEQRIVAEILGLDRDQAGELVKLPPGKGIARYASDTIPDPFFINIQQPEWMK